jgi:hypothetical protein
LDVCRVPARMILGFIWFPPGACNLRSLPDHAK